MRYIQPFGGTDPDGAYVNGNPAVGLTGFIPPAESVEHKMREIVSLIRNSGFLPDGRLLNQMTQSVRCQWLNFSVDTGVADALIVAYEPALKSLPTGLPLRVRVAEDNTGPTTITVDGIGPIFVLRATGSNLVAGDLRAGEIAEMIFDGAYFQLSNFMGYSSEHETNNYYKLGIPYTEDVSVVPNLIQANFDPVITSLAAGTTIEVKIANTNTAATNIVVNSLPIQSVRIPSGSTRAIQELESGQAAQGMIALLVYDGMQFQLINPGKPQAASVMMEPVQIVKMQTVEDPNQHIVDLWSYGELLPTIELQKGLSVEEPIFEFDYTPVGAGNKLRIEITGAVGYVQPRIDPSPCVLLYLAYSYGDAGFNPSIFPGIDFPTVGSFSMNTAVMNFQRYPIVVTTNTSAWQSPNVHGLQSGYGGITGRVYGYYDSANPHSLDLNFKMLGQLVIPPGPPATLKFRLSITAYPSYVREFAYDANDHIVHGGTVYQLTEFTR